MKSVKYQVWSEAELNLLSMLPAQTTDELWVYVLDSLWVRVEDQIEEQVRVNISNEISQRSIVDENLREWKGRQWKENARHEISQRNTF